MPREAAGGEDDLLGVRSGAALIDLALLSGLFIVLSVTIGEASVGGGGFSFSLNSYAAAGLYVGLVLVYYFALEATIGQTVGKLLVGLRVVRANGDRPSVWAVATRTLLRVVDWLPLLYLVGFISMLATGARQQRLGDLAARTGMARAVPIRHRGRAVAVVASTLVLVVAGSVTYAAATDEDGGAKTYRKHGVSFAYPAGWREGTLNVKASSGGDELWEAVVGTGGQNAVIVEAFRLSAPITVENLDEVKPEAEAVLRQLVEQLDGTVRAGPEEITVAGRPSLRFHAATMIDGTPVVNTVVFVFDGTTQYLFSCGHTAGNADEIERGCEQILRTFALD